ncbi:MAG TPA: double-strand break repair protein AddB [Paracoccaceae bacterium]
MFDSTDKARVFGLPPGVDFPKALVQGLMTRHAGHPPDALARVQLIVNTRRMARRIRDLFDAGPALLLPRIQLVTDLGDHADLARIAPAVSPLRRRLEISQLVARLLDSQPDLAPRASLYDLSDSLANLLDEMQGEGVSPDVIRALDVTDQSGHWARAQQFLGIVQQFFDGSSDSPDREARQRRVIEGLIARWDLNPPQHPVIVAGSTGSRGTTRLLMSAVARLPQGAIVLPGFDFDMPDQAWSDLNEALTAEDHPQFRFRLLMRDMELEPSDIQRWSDLPPPCPPRNAVMSLALRPAPVTDQWLSEGPALRDIPDGFANVTLVEAPSLRTEAMAIALRLRQAAEEGITAALITPDRMLTRQVTAALDRWNILPDDSAGTPLNLSPPGRFLRHVAALFQHRLTAEALITLLGHPLTHTGANRGTHLRLTRELELSIRRYGPPFPDAARLRAWAAARKQADAADWIEWVISCFIDKCDPGEKPLQDRCVAHVTLAEKIAQGGEGEGTGTLWEEKPGREARRVVDMLRQEAGFGGEMDATDYADLFGAILSGAEVRDRDAPHPRILIWGTLEARVQGADLVILGGLNEGSWPEMPSPDPWLNRRMRHDAGLLLPERRIGLSAHDFQQAIAAPEVWLTRSIRSDDAQTVASRWLNRMMNLLDGLPDQGGPTALRKMRERGGAWLNRVAQLETPIRQKPAVRPSPRPPVTARPKQLSVTEIKRLIRDPYAIYARHVLGLRPLDSLMQAPDALLRGIVTHDVLETFIKTVRDDPDSLTEDRLMTLAEAILAQNVPWPEMRVLWKTRLARAAPWFVSSEKDRRAAALPILFEQKGAAELPELGFTLTVKADRIDQDDTGALHIYDYKTGSLPSKDEQRYFDKQLLLEAAMAERGAFLGLDPAPVAKAAYIGVGSTRKEQLAPLDEEPPEKVWQEFAALIRAYSSPKQGYTSRRAVFKEADKGDYDQLARFGEWDATQDPTPEDLT